MSTKCSIKFGDDWHLYRETMDDSIHLEIEGDIDFEASPGRVDVQIPAHVAKALGLEDPLISKK